MTSLHAIAVSAFSLNPVAVVSDDSSHFIQTQWEADLDLIVNPTLAALTAHLQAVPEAEKYSDMAVWLRGHIDDISPFSQSDWEARLDLIVDPTPALLRSHLAEVPLAEANSEMACYLRSYISSLALSVVRH